ncbi:hypothetical protein THRCLA_03449 [Thraustotheca clavata]|uniref:Cytochrome b5 heme-binding domain-containing protein n=1 Tax=Thraustotheca clavata TaxID=74557 RepID=A0A1W0A271_9STRA|nr:hypothetical protein THRCLA_03449 [Thraustotheca clavata]
MAKTSRYLLVLAVIIGVLGVFWPQIEEAFFQSCPFLFRREIAMKNEPIVPNIENLPIFTREQLKEYDGSDESKPIYLAVGGKVVDATLGSKFYKKGATYSMFAGQACTRALTISSLDPKDLSDDIADFTLENRKELHETLAFYYDKYPIVGVMDYEFIVPPIDESP